MCINAQEPLAETVEDFWMVVYQQRVSVIAMLTQSDRARGDPYWPQTVGESLNIRSR